MKNKAIKTNAMRILDQAKIRYEVCSYEIMDPQIDAIHVAEKLSVSPELIYKTIVLENNHGEHAVALVPSTAVIDLKKVAAHFGVKSFKLIDSHQLKSLTGYIRGGCSPIVMKKPFPTVIDIAAKDLAYFYVSAGQIGWQIVLSPRDLSMLLPAEFIEIT